MDVSPSVASPPASSSADADTLHSTSLPTTSCRKIVWKDLVQHYQKLHLYDTARFYAERAWYDVPTPEHAYQLAQIYYLQGKINQCYLILHDSKTGKHTQNQYLLAMCCVSLNKFEEAESILSPKHRFSSVHETFSLSEEELQAVPGGAAGLFLLGKLCRRQQRHELAAAYYKYAIEVSRFVVTTAGFSVLMTFYYLL